MGGEEGEEEDEEDKAVFSAVVGEGEGAESVETGVNTGLGKGKREDRMGGAERTGTYRELPG